MDASWVVVADARNGRAASVGACRHRRATLTAALAHVKFINAAPSYRAK